MSQKGQIHKTAKCPSDLEIGESGWFPELVREESVWSN